jgi:integrase
MNELSKKGAISNRKYERFGEIIRHLTLDEMHQFFDCIDNYTHKLMFETIYELGSRVGEFVRIQVRHLNFTRSTVYFPAENTKTKHPRTSYLPPGRMNELLSMLKQKGIITKRGDRIQKPDAYLFHPGRRWNIPYTENRIRQIFQEYVYKAGLQHVYGTDTKGRQLKMFTVHSLRHYAEIGIRDIHTFFTVLLNEAFLCRLCKSKLGTEILRQPQYTWYRQLRRWPKPIPDRGKKKKNIPSSFM